MSRTKLSRVLLTNDDGIAAPGLAVLEAVAAEIADEVWVVAPEHDQSGTSHSLSLHDPLRVTEAGPRRFAVSGTPGDCATIGIRHILRDAPPDYVLSGINRGMNLGIETAFSGTVGAAMTAMMLGVPAIALSQQYTRGRTVAWETSRAVAPDVIRTLVGWGAGLAICLNVNIPDLEAAELGPITLSRQGPGLVETIDVDSRTDPRGGEYHWLKFRRSVREQAADTDVAVVGAGRISVTPLRYDRTDEAAYAALARRLAAG